MKSVGNKTKLRIGMAFLSWILAGTICAAGPGVTPVPLLHTAHTQADSSLLKPTDIVYSDAMEFSMLLRGRGFPIQSVHRSTMEGFFLGVDKAAFVRTSKGIIEVIFFSDAAAAKRIEVTEQRDGAHYVYSFRGQPDPNPASDTINAAYRHFFIVHKQYFMITSDRQMADALNKVFAQVN